MPKVTGLPVQPSGDIVDADVAYLVDVTGPTSEQATWGSIAASAPFSSRYQPQANDRLFISAGAFGITQGSPSLTLFDSSLATTRHSAWMFDDSAAEAVGAWAYVPPWWQTFNVKLWWGNPTTNAGDVRWSCGVNSWQDGDTITDQYFQGNTFKITAAAQFVVKVTTLFSGVSVIANEALHIQIIRAGAHVEDTLTGDAGMFGVSLERAS